MQRLLKSLSVCSHQPPPLLSQQAIQPIMCSNCKVHRIIQVRRHLGKPLDQAPSKSTSAMRSDQTFLRALTSLALSMFRNEDCTIFWRSQTQPVRSQEHTWVSSHIQSLI